MILNYRRCRKMGRVQRVLRNGDNQWKIVGKSDSLRENSYSSEGACFIHMELSMFGGTREKHGEVMKQYLGKVILSNNREAVIYDCGEKGTLFFNGIYYWNFEIGAEVYTVYEVGFGHRAIYYCVYFQGKTVAILSVKMKGEMSAIEFDIYAMNHVPLDLLGAIATFVDVQRYQGRTDTEAIHCLNTFQKKLRNKYDRAFIENIKREG